jgi:uncharacterized protein (DUF4415 family)
MSDDLPAPPPLPPDVVAAIRRYRKRRGRGPQKTPTKVAISLRLDRDVLAALRAEGRGWQTRVNDLLRDFVANKAHGKR